jgi:hypothetical protein
MSAQPFLYMGMHILHIHILEYVLYGVEGGRSTILLPATG